MRVGPRNVWGVLAAAALLVAATGTGCAGLLGFGDSLPLSDGDVGQVCAIQTGRQDTPCAAGLTCVNSVCREPCGDGGSCPYGELCEGDGPRGCLPVEGGSGSSSGADSGAGSSSGGGSDSGGGSESSLDGGSDSGADVLPDVGTPESGVPCQSADACTDLTLGALLTYECSSAQPPQPAGGTIIDGTYVLQSETGYGVPGCAPFQERATFLFNGSCLEQTIQSVSGDGGTNTQLASGTFIPGGTTLQVTITCPSSFQATVGYTASGNQLQTFNPDNGGVDVQTYLKQ